MLAALIHAPALAALVTWTWTAPTTGTPVHHYVVEVRVEGGSWVRLTTEPTDNRITMDQTANLVYEVRVAGVDAQGHQGVWSPISDPDVYGAPGACGKPGPD